MAVLKIYKDKNLLEETDDQDFIKKSLAQEGINFENWNIDPRINSDISTEEISVIYQKQINKVLKDNSFSNFDIVNIKPNIDGLEELKKKFIPEHTHDDNEVRFFIDGEGLFCIHTDKAIYQLLCKKGDYIAVPANTKHWFDMGSKANFKCIRFFENKEGWVAKYTNSSISSEYPLFDEF